MTITIHFTAKAMSMLLSKICSTNGLPVTQAKNDCRTIGTTQSRTALSKLFRFTEPFAKRKGRTAETVRPSRPIAFVSRYHLYEKEAKPTLFCFSFLSLGFNKIFAGNNVVYRNVVKLR